MAGGDYALRLDTVGLSEVETSKDINEPGVLYLPPPAGPDGAATTPPPAELLFFFNDLVEADGWDLIVAFAPTARGTWKLNARFSPLSGEMAPEVSIPVRALERGENFLHLRGEWGAIPKLFYRHRLGCGAWSGSFAVGHADWSGDFSVVKRGVDAPSVVAATAHLSGPPLTHRFAAWSATPWTDRAALTEAALAVGRNLLNAQITDERSFFAGGFNLAYDGRRHSSRIPHWIWSWGPAIKLLLDLERLQAAHAAGLDAKFRTAALAAGRRSLAFGVTDPKHPAFGISTVRWEPARATPMGQVEYISTADSLFLAGWGWMSLYSTTGDKAYLDRTRALVAAAERLMGQYPVVPQDWIVERARWTPHTLDESVFGMAGFRRLFEATQSPEVAAAGRRFLDSHLAHMGRESGLLQRAWMRDEDRGMWDPDIKGHAWVLEGYLDAHRLSGDVKYLELARALAQQVIACQREDGAWTYLFRKPTADDPIDDKAVAIWAYLFYDLYRTTHEPAHLAAARRALGWCLRHQERGDDPHLAGALVNENGMAYIRRRPITVLYSTTFFGLALLEELALPPER